LPTSFGDVVVDCSSIAVVVDCSSIAGETTLVVDVGVGGIFDAPVVLGDAPVLVGAVIVGVVPVGAGAGAGAGPVPLFVVGFVVGTLD